ncbi:MAG TPA: acyl-CoA dehydrogenase family protein, partial [Polyangiaceae bacterium]|nr:acyl-CoA dehydrogenase family protein [Polyangiaceae bacterium]
MSAAAAALRFNHPNPPCRPDRARRRARSLARASAGLGVLLVLEAPMSLKRGVPSILARPKALALPVPHGAATMLVMPSFELSEQQQALVRAARDFTRKEIIPEASRLDEAGTFPREICHKAWEAGLLNCEIPEAYGGVGLSCFEHCLIIEEIAYGCMGVATTMDGNLLGSMPILIAGTEDQKRRYFGRLLESPIFAAYCCSEPDAGSDVAGLKSSYRKDGDGYILTGQKRWITNGGVADFYTVFARQQGTERHAGISCFVVDRNLPGVSTGKKENKMGQRASDTSDVLFEDVRLGPECLVGREGEGFKLAMRTFDRT